MKQSDFELHYPDGKRTHLILEGMAPDAFLLVCPQGSVHWVSLDFSLEKVSFIKAQEVVRKKSIDNRPCCLMNLFPLWYFVKVIDKVNDLLRQLHKPVIPIETSFWAEHIGHETICRGWQYAGNTVCGFKSPNGETPMAVVLPAVCIGYNELPREKVQARQKPEPKKDESSTVAQQQQNP